MEYSANRAGLLGLMLVVGALSLFFFSHQSLRLDEAQSLWQTGRSAADILTIVSQDVHVPLYHELLHFWRLYAGDSVGMARLLSLIFYIASIPLLYLLGKAAYGTRSALFATALFAISPFMNWYGSEIRMYTLFTFLVIVSQYCFIRILYKGVADETDHAWAFYAISGAFGIFSHYFFILMLASQAVFLVLRRRLFARGAMRRFITVWVGLALLFVPWALMVFNQGQSGNAAPVLSVPTTINLFNTFSQFVLGFQDNHLNTVVLSLWPATVVLGFLAMRKTTALKPETEYFIITVLLSTVSAFILSILVAPVFVSRYLIFTVPSLYLLLSSFISMYPPRAGGSYGYSARDRNN